MAQNAPHFCPRCGAPIMSGQHTCANCGLDLSPRADSADHPSPIPSFTPVPPSSQSYTPVPPAVQAYASGSQFPEQDTISQYPPVSPQAHQPVQPPVIAMPARTKRATGRVGMVIGLLVVAVLGVAAYFVIALLGVQVPGFATSGSQPAVTTTTINQTINYAGADITILNAQQSDRFINDPNTSTNGMLRLNLREQNNTTVKISWLYTNSAQLILPGGQTVAPAYVKATVGIAPGATQASLVDFAVPGSTDVRKIILRLGTSSEVQMDIPLTGHANLAGYDPITVKLNGQMVFMGLNWTLTQATSQLHEDGQQASKGMRYVTVTLSVDNTLSQEAIIGSPYTYMRLKTGTTLLSPVSSTLPISFAASATGKLGTVTFLASQKSTAFTLQLQPQDTSSGFDPASADFQIA